MRHPFLCVAFAVVLGLILLRTGRADDASDATAFLADAHARYADHTARALASFTAELKLRRSQADSLRNYKDMAGYGYAWKSPDTETFDFAATHESLQKPLRDATRGLYRELSGGLWWNALQGLKDLAVSRGESAIVLSGTHETAGPVRATFAPADLSLSSLEFPRARTAFSYGYVATAEGLQPAWRELAAGDAAPVRAIFRVLRKVNGYLLPTVLEFRSEKNVTEFGIEYVQINGSPALPEVTSAEEVQRRVQAFEKSWRTWSAAEKVTELRRIAELGDDRVSTAIARLGLKDGMAYVRREAAETLGVMGRANVVPSLLSALKRSEDDIEAYLSVIRALGEIGDPRAVNALSKDWWNQKIGEDALAAARAKISALGRIRHATAVDALIDTVFMARAETIAQLKPDLVLALSKLTGEAFGDKPLLWKDWWKRNRTHFEFD